MAKQQERAERAVTKKETVRKRRDVEANRRVALFLVAVGILLVGFLGAGVLQELVLKPRQPVATVNGTSIAGQDYSKRVLFDWLQNAQDAADPQGSSVTVLDSMVDDQLILQQAKLKGISVSQDEITQAIEHDFGYYSTPPTPTPTDTITPSPTPGTPTPTETPAGTPAPTATPAPTSTPVSLQAYQTAYKNWLDTLNKNTGMTEADFRKLVETDLIKQKMYDQVTADVPKTAEMVRVRHILVAIRTPEPTPAPTPTGQPAEPPTATASPFPTGQPTPTATPTEAPTPTPLPPRDDAQALARIIEAQQKLGSGEDFAKVAEQYSDDTGTAKQGGELGWIARGMGLDKAFEDAAFSQPVGKVGQPVKSQFGYHLIEVEEKDPKHPLDDYTYQQNKYTAWQNWLTTLRSQAKIVRNWSLDKVPPTPQALATG